MMFFDVRTAFILLGLLYLLLPTVTWVILARQRNQQVGLWCAGGFLVGGASILMGLHTIFSEQVYLVLVAAMYRVGFLLRIQSLRLDLQVPWRWRWMVLGELSILLVFIGLHYGLQDYILRVQFNSVIMAGLLFCLARLSWQISDAERSPSAKWISWVYGLVTLVMLFRIFAVRGRIGDINLVNEGGTALVLAASMLLASVIGHFGYVGLALDRSMRREINTAAESARDEEAQRLGAQIAQLDRQRSLGELSASLAHELNQPLTVILTYAQVAKRGVETGRFNSTQQMELLDKIVLTTQRAGQIIERIRDYIRPSPLRFQPVNLVNLVDEVLELVASEVEKYNVNLLQHSVPSPIMVNADPIQLSQIILNGLRNAIEALAEVSSREIHISFQEKDDRALVRIRDTGLGVPAEVLKHIGTPFFTTKMAGMGLGLSISRAIAKQHGGTLTLSNAGDDVQGTGGAVLELNLPRISKTQP